jgi:hypothetical protein
MPASSAGSSKASRCYYSIPPEHAQAGKLKPVGIDPRQARSTWEGHDLYRLIQCEATPALGRDRRLEIGARSLAGDLTCSLCSRKWPAPDRHFGEGLSEGAHGFDVVDSPPRAVAKATWGVYRARPDAARSSPHGSSEGLGFLHPGRDQGESTVCSARFAQMPGGGSNSTASPLHTSCEWRISSMAPLARKSIGAASSTCGRRRMIARQSGGASATTATSTRDATSSACTS